MKQIKKYLKMVSPFNAMEEMPVPIYILKKMLAFCVIYFSAAILGEVIIIGGLCLMGYDPLHGVMPPNNIATLIKGYGFISFTISAIIYCKFIEKRSLKSLGFNHCIWDYLLGSGIAVILLGIIMGIACIMGELSYVGMGKEIDYVYVISLLLAFMIQGAAEETLCRGFLMPSLLKKVSTPLAIACSATAFVFPHLSSVFAAELPFAVIGTINLYLISIAFSLLILYRSNIWVSCGLHSVWNFLYGIFGLTLSGSETNTTGVICFNINTENIISGGSYGMEASIVTTIILGIAVIIIYRCWNRKSS